MSSNSSNAGTAMPIETIPGKRYSEGFTLMETMVALGIFLIVLVATAQGLVSSFNAIKMQEERTSAISSCRSVMATMRQIATYQPTSEPCPEGTVMFPCVLENFVYNFPETKEDIGSDPDLTETYSAFFALPEQRFSIELTDADGNPINVDSAILSANTNPVFVRVSTTWRGFKGQILRFDIRSIITNR